MNDLVSKFLSTPATQSWAKSLKDKSGARVGTMLALDPRTPDETAEAMRVGEGLGLPANVVAADVSGFKRQLDQKKNTTVLSGAPKTAKWLEDLNNGILAKDDIDNLSWFEKSILSYADMGEAITDSQFGRGVQTGATGAKQIGTALKSVPAQGNAAQNRRLLDLYEQVGDMDAALSVDELAAALDINPMSVEASFAHGFLTSNPDRREKYVETAVKTLAADDEIINETREAIEQFSADMQKTQGRTPNFSDIDDVGAFADWFAFNSGQSLPYLAITGLAGLLTGGAGVVGSGYLMGVGDINAEMLEQGITDQANNALVGAIPYAGLELLGPAARPFRNVGGNVLESVAEGYFKRAAKEVPANAVEEFINEAGQEIIKDLAVADAGGEEVTLDNETLLRWFDSGMAGAAGGASVSAVSTALTPRQNQINRDMQSAANAGTTAAAIDEIDRMAANSKLRERAPDKFAEALDAQGESDFYIAADDLREYFQAKDMEFDAETLEAWGIDPIDFRQAESTGGDVTVSRSAYATRISGTEDAAWFRDNAIRTPGEMSVSQAARFNSEVRDVMDQALADAEDQRTRDLELRDSDVKVYDNVFSQLRAAGRTRDVADNEARVWSSFWRTMADRYGGDPLELAQSMGVQIVGPQTPDAARRRNDLDIKLNTLRSNPQRALRAEGTDLLDFVRSKGGISDTGGDVAAMDAPKGIISETREQAEARRGQPNMLGLSDSKGTGLDEIGRAAIEAGYFPELMGGSDVQADGTVVDEAAVLLEALQRAISGEAIYPVGEGPNQDMVDLSNELSRRGIDLAMSNDEIAAALEDQGGLQYDQSGKLITDTPEFRAWFGDSKVVDGNGDPLVVYHGTRSDFESFRPLSWLATEPEMAETYAQGGSGSSGSQIIAAYASISNPFDTDLGLPNSPTWREFAVEAMDQLGDALTQEQAARVQEIIVEGEKIHPGAVDKVAFWQSDFISNLENLLSALDYDGLIYREESALNVSDADTERAITYAALSPTQIKSVYNRGTFDANDPRILFQSAAPSGSDAFRAWAGTDEVLDPDEVNDTDFSGSGPWVVRSFHGTTHEFSEFDASIKGTKEGQFGAVNYFTTSEADASNNYGSDGADLTRRIENAAEKHYDDITDIIEDEGRNAALALFNDPDIIASADGLDSDELAIYLSQEMARKQISGETERVLEVFIRTEKPFVVGGKGSPFIEFADFSELEAQAIARVADDEGVTVEEIEDARDDYEDQIDEARWDLEAETENPLFVAVQEVADRYDMDASALLSDLSEISMDGTDHNTLEKIMRDSEGLMYAEDPETGDTIGYHVLAEIVEALGFDSIILKNADQRFKNMDMDSGTAHIHVFDSHNTNIKSVDNQGTFDRSDPRILYQGNIDSPEAGEVSGVPFATNLARAFQMAMDGTYTKGRQLKVDLQERSLEAQREAGIDLTTLDDENIDRLADFVVEDAREALRDNSNAIGWYDRTVTRALETAAEVFPEILTNPTNRLQFTWAMAVTSNGLKVDKNFEVAGKAYEALQQTGRFPKNAGIGTAAAAINGGLAQYHTMLEKFDGDHVALTEFMNSKVPVRQIEQEYGVKISGEGKGTLVRGASILGPKIGNGFFSNLYGNFDELTMDRWLMRSVGRWRGTLIERKPAMEVKKRAEIKDIIASASAAELKAIRALYKGGPASITKSMTAAQIDVLAVDTAKRSMDPAWRTELNKTAAGEVLRKSGNGLAKYLDGQVEAPAGANERTFIRNVFQKALTRLQDDPAVRQQSNAALTMSDLQALLWYPEKRLYDTAKSNEGESRGYEDDDAPDYANAARKFVNNRLGRDGSAGRSGRLATDDGRGVVAGVQPNGSRGGGRRLADGSLAPLEGTPTLRGHQGPIQDLVKVAEAYAQANGIDYVEQGEYVAVDEARASRIAAAYEAMENAPQDPAVQEAYQNMIGQTVAQYQALVDAGYEFFFIVPESNTGYGDSPITAMEDLRVNKRMGVYATESGFGPDGVDASGNPMLADTGIEWLAEDGNTYPVLANDLFRAVHDAFGHGLEGVGFRAQGEENAWQAHVRLFTGSAVAAITTETRGQNSWVNFGPNGEANQTASAEDTVFAEQKVGILPSWTWEEGRAVDADNTRTLFQKTQEKGPLGSIQLPSGGLQDGQTVINLFESANLSTFIHESGHFFLEAFTALATSDTAPQGMKDDLAAIHKFLKVDGTAPLTTAQHEMWARAFEAYAMEGKAPSLALADAFGRFKSWLTRIYKTALGLNVKITPEIREVMDRMLATDAEIAAAREMQQMSPLFTSEAAAGMTPAAWETYQKIARRSEEQASQALLEKTMAKVRREKETWWKEERADVRKEVTTTVDSKPEYRLIEMLANQRWIGSDDPVPDFQIDRAELVETFGDGVLAELSRSRFGGKRAIYGADGISLYEASEFFGFANPTEMVETLQNTGKKKDAIELETDRIMSDRYGDPLNDGSIEEEAVAAIHSDQQAQTVAAEARHLAGQAGKSTRNMTAKVFRQRARMMLSRMSVKDATRPNAFLEAERRSAKRAEDAFARTTKGRNAGESLAAAAKHKEQQMLNHYLYMESRDLTKMVASKREKMRNYSKASVREKLDGGYIEQIDALLEGYDFRVRSAGQIQRSEKLRAFVERMVEDGREGELAIDERLLDEANRKHYTKMSVDELQGLFDTIENIDHMGRHKQKLIDAKNKRDLQEVADTFSTAISNRFGTGKAANQSKQVRNFFNLLFSVDTMMVDLDGTETGDVYDLFKAPLDRGQALEQQMNVAMAEAVDDISSVYSSKELSQMQVQKLIPGGNGHTWSKMEIISLALNTGHQDGRNRILEETVHPERRLTQDQLDALLDTLEKGDWDFVQSMLKQVNSYWPELAATHNRRTGTTLKKVEAVPIETKFGVYPGGYYPLAYDSQRSIGAAKDEASAWDKFNAAGRGSRIEVKSGMTIARKENSGGRTLDFDLNVALRHMRDTIRVITMSEVVDNAARIIKHKDVETAFMDAGQTNQFNTLKLFLDDLAVGPVYNTDEINAAARMIKNNFTMAKLAFNFKTVALQVTGITQSAVVVGKRNMVRGYRDYLANPNAAVQMAMEKSAFMSERKTSFQKDIYDQVNDIQLSSPLAKRGTKVKNAIGKAGFYPMIRVQFLTVDVPTWIAAHDAKLREGATDEAAVKYADRIVARSQGSGLYADRNALERGTTSQNMRQSDFIRLWTTLGSYMVTKMNRGYLAAQKGKRGISEAENVGEMVGSALNMASDLALLYMAEAIMMGLTYALLAGDDADEEDLTKFIMTNTATSVIGGVPIVSGVANAFQGYGAGGILATFLEMPANVATQLIQGENDAALWRSISDAGGMLTGLPSTATYRAIEGIVRGADEGELPLADMFFGSNPLTR